MYNLPLRLTTLHLAQRLRMEGPTFMLLSPYFDSSAKVLIILAHSNSVQFGFALAVWLRDSQDERVAFGDGNGMFKMRRQ